jgi:hypothetical protein
VELTHLFEPEADESPLGYYRRLSAANALTSWRELAIMAEVSPSRTGLLGAPEHIASTLNIPAPWTARMAKREQELRTIRSLHRSRRDAVCPPCLAQAMYLRSGWEHAYATACVRHRVRLVDRCSSCDTPLDLNREQIGQCSCGQELAHLACEPATDAQLWLSSLLDGDSSICVGPDVAGAEQQRVAQLAKLLCQGFNLAGGPARRNAAAPQSISEATEFLAPLALCSRAGPRHTKPMCGRGWRRGRPRPARSGRCSDAGTSSCARSRRMGR